MKAHSFRSSKPKYKFTFRVSYFLLTIFLFIAEVLIALYAHDNFVRPYVGDFLVVILLYCGVRTFLKASPLPVAIGVLAFAFLIEMGQYYHFVSLIGLGNSTLARVVLGNSFATSDLLAYTLGIVLVIMVERKKGSLSF